jgi:hypothetical protein
MREVLMPRRNALLTALLLLLLVATQQMRAADQILIPPGSAWKYNATGTNLGSAWRAVSYNDASWPTGLAQLGYGDGDETTVLPYGSSTLNRYITYYFRRSFTVSNPSAFASLALRYVRDDGCVIYLNGVEVVRSNMPTGTISYSTRATTSISGAGESAWLESPVDPALLVAGTNVIAVELHQQSPSSSDISFNLELRAVEAQTPGPSVTLTSPANHAVSNSPAVTFAANVSSPSGLAGATLYVGGPAQTVAFSGPTQIEDAEIVGDTPTVADGSGLSLNVDGQTPHAHTLMKIPGLVGPGATQVPAGATITSATLLLNCTNAGNAMRVYRLTQSWVEDQATWNERATGTSWGAAGADGAASNAGVALTGDCTVIGQRAIDVTPFVQEWSNGTPNHGVVFIESGTDGVDFDSSESAQSPVLSVTFKSTQQPIETKAVSGTSATVSFDTTLTLAQTYYWNVLVTDLGGKQATAAADFDVTIDAGAPNPPVLLSPADGATGVPTSSSLMVSVSDPAGGALTVSAKVRKMPQPEFTIIALPDTQHYSESFPAIFTAQTQWIVDNKLSRNIVFVTHEGDIVEHYNLTTEWQRANTSMSLLDGVVPYGMGPGNHDLPTTNFNLYFPYTRYQGEPWYGGHMGSLNDDNFQLFSAGGLDFVIVHLEFCPPAAAVSWASSVLQSYPNRIGMMTTHGYLGLSAERSVHGCTNTQYLWDGLAVPNPNLHFMFAGHVHGESRRTDIIHGHPVYQMLADFQERASGGEGWLRIVRFVPADDRVYVQTYSPWLNRYESDADSEFTLDFPMGGAFTSAGSVAAASGSTASIPLTGLSANTQYEWQVTVTNASGKSRTGPVWRFTTAGGGPVNQPPSAANQSVSGTEDTALPITLAASDPEGAPLTYSILSGPARGSLTGTAPSLVYQPSANSSGADSFTFRVSDGQAISNTATVSITTAPVNDAPAAAGDSYSTQVNTTLTVSAPGVLGNDGDIDSATLTTQLVTSPAQGTLTLNANGSFVYTPTAGYTGPDSFSYRASDGALTSAAVTVTLSVNSAPTNLIAAYSFNEGTGTTLTDRSGRGHTGTIAGATWSTQGRFGGALSFDGVNDWVTVNDTAALDLTTAMTLEAWVRPSALAAWRTVLMKERTGGLAYTLYGSDAASRMEGYLAVGSAEVGLPSTAALALNTWTHLAFTYDGATMRVFVNGTQVATRTQTGAMATSTGALRIGGNSVWGEYFQGLIDEVRIYNRALTQAEIQTDMNREISP